jgi:Double-GTPase 1
VNETNVVLIGFNGSGKTTFLAALWHSVKAFNSVGEFQIKVQPQDREYLNAIEQRWMACEPQVRNERDDHHEVSLELISVHDQSQLHLNMPDVPGEAFLEAWADRRLDQRIFRRLEAASGIVLFLGPNPFDPQLISQVQDGLQLGNETIENGDPVDWNPREHSRTDTMVTELVQIARRARIDSRKILKISVIHSAWDQHVVLPKMTPHRRMRSQFRLLNQYLETNRSEIESRVYGVSAQGCNYELELDRKQALQNHNHMDRILVVDEDIENDHDLLRLIRWMMEES